MKISSENVSGIERTVTPPLNRNNNNNNSNKYLNHSSSLPSLKGKDHSHMSLNYDMVIAKELHLLKLISL